MADVDLHDAPAASKHPAVKKENVRLATLDVPDTTGACISSAEFAETLEKYRVQIVGMIDTLKGNAIAHDKYSLHFIFNFHRNGIDKVEYLEDGNNRSFELDCYCNGGE